MSIFGEVAADLFQAKLDDKQESEARKARKDETTNPDEETDVENDLE